MLKATPHRGAATPGDAEDGATWICVPTYNEAENVARLVERVLAVLDRSGIDGRLLVIDDASPDGTGDIAEGLARADERVRVLHREEKQGIGPAYRDGFRAALAEGAARVVEMDCDLSHDPEALPALVTATRHADVVLGSRYVPGGRIEDWGLVRRLISRLGCLYAQGILWIPVSDLTGGFKCFRSEVLRAIPLEEVAAAGYGFQVEITYRAWLAGFRVAEVPITFRERDFGRSKMSGSIVAEAAVLVPRLRRRLGHRPAPAPPGPVGAGR